MYDAACVVVKLYIQVARYELRHGYSIKGFRLNEDQHLRWPYTFEEIAKPTKGFSTYIDSYQPNAVIETLL